MAHTLSTLRPIERRGGQVLRRVRRFLRDASIDQRLLLAVVHEREGRGREARQELQHLPTPNPTTSEVTTNSGTFGSTKVCWTKPSNTIAGR